MCSGHLPRATREQCLQTVSCRQVLLGEYCDAAVVSWRVVLSGRHHVRVSVSVSYWHLQQQHGCDICIGLSVVSCGQILRLVGSDGSYGSVPGGIFLRGRQLRVYAFQERVGVVGSGVLGELLGRHVLVAAQCDGERHMSSRSLLSCGQHSADAMSAGYEQHVDRSDRGGPV